MRINKQASDDEDNEIEIVEPKTDLITLDSDDDEPATSTPIKSQQAFAQFKSQPPYSSPQHGVDVKVKPGVSPLPITQTNTSGPALTSALPAITPLLEENLDLMSMAQSFLASMLEVEIQEGPLNSPGSDSSGQKKQPRKKLTNKPNPTLLKQKALMERERLEEMKRNDQKLKMKCSVELKRAEEVFPYAKEMLETRAKEKLDIEEDQKKEEDQEITTLNGAPDKDNVTVKVVIQDEAINVSTEEKNENEDNDANRTQIEEKEITEITVKITEGSPEINPQEMIEKEASMENNDTSFEIIVEMTDKSAERIAQIEKAKTEEGNNEEADVKLDNTLGVAVLKTVDENIEQNKSNGLSSEDKLQETMETDESPPAVAKDESMEIDDKESPQTIIAITGDPEVNETTSNELDLESDQQIEKVLQPQEDSSEDISNKDVINQDQQQDDNVDENVKKSVESTNEHELISHTEQILLRPTNCDVEHPTARESTEKENNKDTVRDLSMGEEEITDKILPSLVEDLPSKEQTIETPTTEFKETTASRNGNV